MQLAGALLAALLGVISAAAEGTGQRAAELIGNPPIGTDNYPREALRARASGLVIVMLDIDARGKATACRVERSSGSDILDGSTCALMIKAHYRPARGTDGQATTGVFRLPVRWTLPGLR